MAIIRGECDRVVSALAHGEAIDEPDDEGMHVLHRAALHCDARMLQLLIDNGANVNALTPVTRATPLSFAVDGGDAICARILIDAGADVHILDNSDTNVLWSACRNGTRSGHAIANLLLDAGADPATGRGMSALMCAAQYMRPELVQRIVDTGINVNAVYSYGTALTQAIIGNRDDNVAVLLRAGADLTIPLPKTHHEKALAGLTPLEMAKKKRAKKIISLLEAALKGQLPVQAEGNAAAPAVKATWKRLEKALKRQAPEAIKSLNRKASEKSIMMLEKLLGVTLPDDFRQSCMIHDGQASGSAVNLVPAENDFDIGYELLSLEGIRSEWQPWRELVDLGEFAGQTSAPDKGIADDWWRPQWIPIASNGGGDSIRLDLAPTSDGRAGQVITMSHESPERRLLAPSFAHWLAELAEAWEARET